MDKILFSVVIPVYNTEKLLPECLDSILEQDFDKSRYEIVCVDDGSPDNAGKVLDRYAAEYGNVKVIHKENGGVALARQIGFENASGEYIWFVDSDDFVNVDSLNILEKALVDNDYPEHMNFKYCRFPWDGKENRASLMSHINTLKVSSGEATIWNSIYKKEFLDKYEIVKKTAAKRVSFAEDTLFNFYAKCFENSYVQIEEALYLYRINPDSVMQQKDIQSKIKHTHDLIVVSAAMKDVVDDYDSGKYNCQNTYPFAKFLPIMRLAMEKTACLPLKYGLHFISMAKREKIYPYDLPDWYDVSKEKKWAYGKNRIEKFLYMHSHTRYGFFLMLLYYTPVRLRIVLKSLLKR